MWITKASLTTKGCSQEFAQLFYFASGGSSWPRRPLRIGMSARSILHTVSMVLIISRI